MIGGIGNDIYFVDSTAEQAVELLNQGTDEIRTTVSLSLLDPNFDNVENLTLLGTGNLNVTGSGVSNVITWQQRQQRTGRRCRRRQAGRRQRQQLLHRRQRQGPCDREQE